MRIPSSPRNRSRLLRRCASALIAMILTVGPAFAQPPDTGPKKEGKQYVVQYVLLAMLSILGLMIVCRPSNRMDDPPFQRE